MDIITTGEAIPPESRPVMKYILGGPSNDQYQLKHRQKKLLKVAIVKAMVNAIHTEGRHEETKPIDGPISFPHVNPNIIIAPHYDALVLTLCINGFDVHRVLVDPSNVAYLLQAGTKKSVFSAKISSKSRLLTSTEEILATDNRLRKKSVENR